MKRYITCLLVMLLLASCGEGSAQPAETTAAETTAAPVETSILDELGVKDFAGRTFTILDANDYPATHINMPGEEMNGDLINDALIERDAKIESLNNCKIEYVQITDAANGTDALRTSVLAGDDIYNLCISTVKGGRLATLATEGILANLCDVPYLSLESNWWSRLIYEQCMIDGKFYFTSGDISSAVYRAPGCVFLNSSLLADYKIDTDFYQMVRDGKWTVDALYAVGKDADRDLNDDGTLHASDDFFGLIHQTNQLTATMLLGGSGVFVCKNDGSGLTLSMDDTRMADIVETLQRIVRPVVFEKQNDIFEKTFIEDRAISLIHCVGTAMTTLREMNSDFMILPLPKYDAAQENHYSLINGYCDCFVGIPVNADAEFTGFIAEAMARESHIGIRPKVYELTLKGKSARDEGSSEMIDYIFNSLYIDHLEINNFGGLAAALGDVVLRGQPLASTVASYQEAANSAISDFTEAWTQK